VQLGDSIRETRVRKGSMADNGLFSTWGRPERVAEDLMKYMGLESGKEFYDRQVRKAVEAMAKADAILAKSGMNQARINPQADLAKDASSTRGSIELRLERLLRRMAHLFSEDEKQLAEKAVRALDIAAFCDIAERAYGRRPY
jgi:hypothetical protein